MKINIYLKASLVAVFVLSIFVGVYWWQRPQASNRHAFIDRLEKQGAIDFQGTDYLRNKPFQLSSLKGRVIIINFWASWCEPCAKEIPELVELVESLQGQAALVAVSNDEDKDELDAFISAFKELNSEHVYVVRDPEREIADRYRVARLPESFVFDKDFKLRRKIVGYIDWFNDSSLSYLRGL